MGRFRSIFRRQPTAWFASPCLFFHIVFLLPSAPYAEPKVNMTYHFYEVSGINTFDLNRQLIQKSPVRSDGKVLQGETQWKIDYDYECNHEDGDWYVDRVTTTVDIQYILPKWINYRRAHRNEQKKWDDYYRALIKHETGHKEIAINAARAIEDRLLNMKSVSDRAELKHKAKRIAETIFQECKELQAQYDAKTDHGRNRGVLLR